MWMEKRKCVYNVVKWIIKCVSVCVWGRFSVARALASFVFLFICLVTGLVGRERHNLWFPGRNSNANVCVRYRFLEWWLTRGGHEWKRAKRKHLNIKANPHHQSCINTHTHTECCALIYIGFPAYWDSLPCFHTLKVSGERHQTMAKNTCISNSMFPLSVLLWCLMVI